MDDELDVNDASIFYDDFPPLPDFPCMPSNSTSSSSSSSSSSKPPVGLASTPPSSDCVDVMENFGYMDLIDCNEIWDPSSVFQGENPMKEGGEEEDEDGFSFLQGNSELAAIFLEWLKHNRDYISAEDMRSIKLKRSTIESASKRLGSSKEGKKQLLKLILEWVEQYQLQKKRVSLTEDAVVDPNPNFVYPSPEPFSVPIPMYNTADPYPVPAQGIPYPSPGMAELGIAYPQFSHPVYAGNPYPGQIFDAATRLGSSATKEARKKRMARQQRRVYSHHHHHRHNTNSSQNQLINDDAAAENWMCWSPEAGNPPASGDHRPSMMLQQRNNASSDRKQQQGWKTEKNLKFLLQKVLKQSDVGNLGRIVLPKKEAESHLPELESRDGISIAMEDIGTSRVWNMRYRFWPNNKSRMYLLENTGDFVRLNGLQEGDFIVIYADTKCGKYMIRGVKVRQPGMKLEGKKPARKNIRNLSVAGNSSSQATARI
ncbi:hypothetical protein ACS0TY_005408 [Phlomoides rotata]